MAKRPSDADEPHLVSKIQRIEHPNPASPHQRLTNNDFSGSVKRKLADAKRTGQACDRCKVRKIRCDGRPEGCTPCEQNRTPCRTTDRITGRATVRGHAEAMESENQYLRNQIADLQAQLKEVGVEPRPTPAYNPLQPPNLPYDKSWSDTPRRTSTSPLPGYAPAACVVKSEFQSLPQFKHGSIGDNYLGVAASDSLLSHIKGTSLSVFGTEIDITDFMTGEAEYESSPMSYTTLVKISVGGQSVDAPPLPPYQGLHEYAMWYLRSLNPYTMLVHKPVVMDLIWRFGNDANFTPTPPQIVTVHMMLATIQYQIATRNSQQSALMEESHAHYLYALSFYKQLLLGRHKLQDVQALAMICHHLRNFPKPGAAWILTSFTYLFAIELGLHRSVTAWADGTGKLSKLDIEMRKRVFWTLNALQVNLNGKLGRPMPISNEDIDVEFPEPMNDCLAGEEASLDSFHQCSFQVGIQIAKYTALEVELYKTIYAVRHSPRAYLDNLKRLEAGIQKWKDELPYELRDASHASQDNHIFALYLEYWYQAYHLLLHHPAVCRSVDPAIVSSNLDKCLDASQKMLHNCTEMMHKKSLDIPWINTVVYIAATFTTLFVSSMRKEHLTPVDMTKLKGDMATWVNVLGECDHFLGSGDKLKNAIAKIIDQSLSNINDSIVKRTATESLARVALQTPQHTSSTSVYDNNGYQEQYGATSSPTDPALTPQASGYSSLPGGTNTSHPYNLGNPLAVSQQSNSSFDQQTYSSAEDTGMNPTHAAALAAAASGNTPQPTSNTYAYANTQIGNSGHQPAYAANGFAPQDWRQWTRTYMQPQLGQPGEYLNTATTLMTLGRGESQGPGNDGPGLVDTSGVQGHVGPHWPEITFSGPANGHMGQQ
ncbi:Nn.00g011300.m01.CDS01 [Neocucurbitaria sp. VM-36]